LYDRYHNYQAAFYSAAGLAAIALVCELLAKRPAIKAAELKNSPISVKENTCPPLPSR